MAYICEREVKISSNIFGCGEQWRSGVLGGPGPLITILNLFKAENPTPLFVRFTLPAFISAAGGGGAIRVPPFPQLRPLRWC